MTGRPPGSENKDKPWRAAIRRAIKGDPEKLDKIAKALLTAAASGDMSAVKELGDRLDGKPAQMVQGSGKNGAIVHKVEVEIVSPSRADS